jgi:iron complex outermembrane receptor protein
MSRLLPAILAGSVLAASGLVAERTAAQTTLPPVPVQPPADQAKAKAVSKGTPQKKAAAQPQAAPPAAPAAQPAPVLPSAASDSGRAPPTPLNSDAVAASSSALGLTVRQTPATVEVIDQQQIKDQGHRTVSEVAQGAVGVTSGDFPAEPSAFSMRGFTNSQINSLYNGIKIGPQNMTSRPMDAANLDRVEILKGPASLMSGEGATGGAINFVTKQPHTGPIVNEAFVSVDTFRGYRAGVGSGGSTGVPGLDYRIDVSRASAIGFIDDTDTKTWSISSQLDYRLSSTFKIFGAIEYKQDASSSYWGTPLVSAAASGPFALGGIVSGNYVSNYNGSNLGPVTIDSRTLKTNYNVLDNRMTAEELWLRAGFEWALTSSVRLKSQFYSYGADREWFNNEIIAFHAGTGLVDRERFYVAHDQKLYGNTTSLQIDSQIAGLDNRTVIGLGISRLDFTRPGAANFPTDSVSLVDPDRGYYGLLRTQRQTAIIDNVSLSIEDRLKLTPSLALIGGLRTEVIELERTSTNVNGIDRPGFPFSKSWNPTTGRVGLTWEAVPGLTFFGQYATAADVAANNLFLLGGLQPLDLTTSRTYEAGIKHVFWNNQAEWSASMFDIERKNVYAAQGGQSLNVAGAVQSQGVELEAGFRPTKELRLWGNIAFVYAHYENYEFVGGSFSGNTPPNVPGVVVNGGASYRFGTPWPLEIGFSVRHVGDRFNTDGNSVKLLSYTTADAFAFLDLPKSAFAGVDSSRLALRVRNLTDETYAAWGDPFYPDQILLGAPRSLELSLSLKF